MTSQDIDIQGFKQLIVDSSISSTIHMGNFGTPDFKVNTIKVYIRPGLALYDKIVIMWNLLKVVIRLL